MSGWIKLERNIRDNWIWQDPIKLKWWIDILMTVNLSEKKVSIGYKLFTCKRGECLMSLQNWGKRWNVSKTVVNNFFRMLENDNMIKTVNETVTTRLIVCNYDSCQECENTIETETKRIEDAIIPQQSTTKEYKEYNKGKEYKYTSPTTKGDVSENEKFILTIPQEWEKIVSKWILYKKQRHESYKSEMSLNIMFKKLLNFSEGIPARGEAIIENSISNNYSGFFELKNYGTSRTGNTKIERSELLSAVANGLARGIQERDQRLQR